MLAVHVASAMDTVFNCAICTARHCDATNPAPHPIWKIEGLITSNVCLKPMVQPWAYDVLGLFKHYRNGHLPHSGGVLEQPKALMEAFSIVENTVASIYQGDQ